MTVRNSLARMAAVGMIGVLGMVAAACGSSTTLTDAIDLVPARSDLVGSVDLSQILGDADVQTAYEMIAMSDEDAPATFADLLAMAQTEIGVDLTGFQEVVLFADLENTDPGYGALLAVGSPPQEDIFAALEAAPYNHLTAGEYGGQDLLIDDEDESAVAVLGDVLVFGSDAAVRDVIDVFNGDVSPLAGDLLAAYNALGDVWVKMVIDVPAGATDDLGDLGSFGLPIDLGGLLDIERVTIVADRNGDDAVLAVTLVYPTEAAATETAETINALLTLLSAFSDDAQLESLTDMLSISATGTSVELEIRQTIQEIMDSLGSALESAGSGSSLFS